ncbi:hypothetical protein ILFOPFJJ_07009 [Ensifer psoraleae]|nr:hypothetical protein [Sinorhizobium psoraleae]
MTYCHKQPRGITRSAELARIIDQRLVVEPVFDGIFVICEEPVAKAEKSTYIILGGALGGLAPDEGLLKPQN